MHNIPIFLFIDHLTADFEQNLFWNFVYIFGSLVFMETIKSFSDTDEYFR